MRWGPLIKADIRDHATLREAMLAHDISAVLHFAACAYVGESVINPQKYYDNNVTGTLVAAAGDARHRHLHHRVLELLRHLRRAGASSHYRGGAEAAGESLWRLQAHDRAGAVWTTRAPTDSNPIALRYFNAAGADPDGEVGELRDPETHLIPRAMMAIQGYFKRLRGVRQRLPDARRHRHQRLHPRLRLG